MAENPYASPSPEVNLPPYTARLILRCIAVCCWLMSLFLAIGIAANWNRPEMAARSAEAPVLAAVVWTVGFILPALGLAILGIASWRLRGLLGLIGLAAFMPFLAFISYVGI